MNSDLVTYELVASQRPSTVLINKYNIISQFKEKNIGLIINVQREGEHPYCGPNGTLESSGYTYFPQEFISNGIDVKLCGWKDMDVPESMTKMLEIVKEMYYHTKILNKKVLVHCHAGYGRTGIVLACYIIYTTDKDVSTVVKEIRSVRKKCIEKSEQYEYCENFYNFINHTNKLFFNTPNNKITKDKNKVKEDENENVKHEISFYINNQAHYPYFQGKISSLSSKFIPVLISEVLTTIKSKTCNLSPNEKTLKLLGYYQWNKEKENILGILKNAINQGNWQIIQADIFNEAILIELLFDWINDNVVFCVEEAKIKSIFHTTYPNLTNNNSNNRNNNNNLQYQYSITSNNSNDKEQIKNENENTEKLKKLKIILSSTEYETLKYIAEFIYNNISDKTLLSNVSLNTEETMFETNQYLLLSLFEKLSFYLLGYGYFNYNKFKSYNNIDISNNFSINAFNLDLAKIKILTNNKNNLDHNNNFISIKQLSSIMMFLHDCFSSPEIFEISESTSTSKFKGLFKATNLLEQYGLINMKDVVMNYSFIASNNEKSNIIDEGQSRTNNNGGNIDSIIKKDDCFNLNLSSNNNNLNVKCNEDYKNKKSQEGILKKLK